MTTLPVLVQMIFAAKGTATVSLWAYISIGRDVDCPDMADQISLAAETCFSRAVLPSALQPGAVARTS